MSRSGHFGGGQLSGQSFGWEHVRRGVHVDDHEFVADYVGDLTGKHPEELRFRYGTFDVPELQPSESDDDRRAPGYTESLRHAVGAGKTPPVIVVQGTVVDGWHRIKAAARNGQRTVEAWHA